MSDVEVNGVHIADDRSGDGPPLVLVVRLPDVFNRGMIELFESGADIPGRSRPGIGE
jgi:hypothetical protein